MADWEIVEGEALGTMASMAAAGRRFAAVICDPPYGILRDEVRCTGGRRGGLAWDAPIDPGAMLRAVSSVIAPGGAAAIFCAPPYTYALGASPAIANLRYAHRWVWRKGNHAAWWLSASAPLPVAEDILVWRTMYDPGGTSPMRDYFRRMREEVPLPSVREMARALGTTGISHAFTRGVQFAIPPRAVYERMEELYSLRDWPGHIPYDEMSRVSNAGKFNLPPGCEGGLQSVIESGWSAGEARGLHPTQKPIALMRLLVSIYTDPGDEVLDFCCGSGSTGAAALSIGRRFTGIEASAEYCRIARDRCAAVQPTLL